MSKKILLLLLLLLFIGYRFVIQDTVSVKENVVYSEKTDKLIAIALSYNGVSYRAGGMTNSGMDCSGLVNTSFKQLGIDLPRSSSAISTRGKEVDLNDVKKGDLLFFDIARLKGGINHVGLVTSVDKGEVFFIHSTTSKGVIISSMNEAYWKNEFVKAKRIFNNG